MVLNKIKQKIENAEKSILPIGAIRSPVVPLQPVPELLHRDAIISSTQSHIQNQLQRKHEELQQLIMKQQEELQLVSEQLHLAQRGMLPVVSSTQIDPQINNRHPIRSHPHQMYKLGNSSSLHRTVLIQTNTLHNDEHEQQTYIDQPINPSVCHTNAIPLNVYSSHELNSPESVANFDDANQTIISPSTPASNSSTMGSLKYTPTSE